MSGIIGSAGSKSGAIGATELDYEEGTWTPGLSSSPGISVTNAHYTKIGRLVTATCYFTATGAGTTKSLTGFPFTSGASGQQSIGAAVCGNVDFSSGQTAIAIMMGPSSTVGNIVTYGDNASYNQLITFSTSDFFMCTITYYI